MNADKRPVAVVTGGSAGLGLVIAKTLLDNGYRVVIVGRDADRLKTVSATLNGSEPERLLAQVCDVTSRAEVDDLIATVNRSFQRLDVLVNCVGASDRGLVENLDVKRLESLWKQNVVTALLCSQASIPLLEASSGTIVNIGSLAAKVGARYIGGYATVKHALAGMTQQMRLELKPRGIRVALVSPGPIARADAGERYRETAR